MHQDIRPVKVFEQNACDKAVFEVKQAYRGTSAGGPSTTSPSAYPWADDIILTDEYFFHRIPPTSYTKSVADHFRLTEVVATCKRNAAA